jgi:Tol biopolymer transport system component
VKQAFRLSCAAVLLVFLVGASVTIHAQTTPDPFVAQITSSARESFAGDISGDGRFVVIESTGDISTEKTAARNNADGNREIFLLDYAQRRIFQITNTTSARVDTSKPAIDFTSAATSSDFSNIKVEVSNNKPTISNNGRWIAFSSNATTPNSFDGDANSAALVADGNQEIFLYFIPATPAVVLSDGDDLALVDLTAAGGGSFTQITNTAASRLPIPGRAGSSTQIASSPFVAFDNRDAAVNDNASVVAFVSTRNLVGTSNQDANPEIFIYRRTPTAAFAQLTVTGTATAPGFLFNENPSLSGDGSVVAFISNADISAGGSANNADGNAEVYLGSFDAGTATATVTRQATRTTAPFSGIGVNFLSPGRRLSRDGNLVAVESLANLSGDNSIQTNTTVFIYNVAGNSFTQVGSSPITTRRFSPRR